MQEPLSPAPNPLLSALWHLCGGEIKLQQIAVFPLPAPFLLGAHSKELFLLL